MAPNEWQREEIEQLHAVFCFFLQLLLLIVDDDSRSRLNMNISEERVEKLPKCLLTAAASLT